MKEFAKTSRVSLIRIAAALNVPVEWFFTGEPSMDMALSADECLRLWFAIETEEGRRQALEVLRTIVETGQR